MELDIAINLISEGMPQHRVRSVWADLGCGKGLLTKALASLLASGSMIYAIDRDAAALRSVQVQDPTILLKKLVHDFIEDGVTWEPCDGMLMANSLHFASDPRHVLRSLKANLKSSGRLLIIEYDTDEANPWVPYPVSFASLASVANKAGFTSVIRLKETHSAYNQANIYSAVIT